MVLIEEHDEQNQKTWLSRVARERQGISVSVEETLGDGTADDFVWLEEDGCGLTGFQPSVQDKALVPPRLSLQSRVVEAVRSDADASSDARSYAVVPSGEVGERKPAIHGTNVLMRFAQRLTSSFGVLNAAPQTPETFNRGQPVPPITMGLKASSLSSIADIEVCTASTMAGLLTKEGKTCFPGGNTQMRQGRQRLAGRTTKIRLEVVAGSPATRNKARTVPALGAGLAPVDADRLLLGDVDNAGALDNVGEVVGANTTGIHLTAIHAKREDSGSLSSSASGWDVPATGQHHVPANTRMAEKRVTQGALSGTGLFASGQSDVTIANVSVTAASVVLVTLTSNPGPVVVQYVSLQPQVGFTVHLTAPTALEAAFNYIILLGELF